MKIRLLIISCVLISNSLVAQSFRYGLSISLGMNDIVPNKSSILNYNEAYKNLIIHRNFTTNIGGVLKYKKAFLELNLNFKNLDNNILDNDNLTISDTYNGNKYLILKSKNTTKEVENSAISITGDYEFNTVIGYELINFNKFSVNLASGIGIQYIKERFSDVVLKDESSNTYFNANYIFKTNRLLTYSPRLELAYHPKKYYNTLLLYFYTGVHIQDSKHSTSRSLSNSSGTIISEEHNQFNSHSNTLMAGIGMRVFAP